MCLARMRTAFDTGDMTDIVDASTRSRMMRGIRSKNTRPELRVRQGLHARGLRYRLHVRDLPGVPDLVFPKFRAVIFVHGCFWHGHGCHMFRWPSTRREFWRDKISHNQEVDARAVTALASDGWRIAEVWECALRGSRRLPPDEIMTSLEDWLKGALPRLEIPAADEVDVEV